MGEPESDIHSFNDSFALYIHTYIYIYMYAKDLWEPHFVNEAAV